MYRYITRDMKNDFGNFKKNCSKHETQIGRLIYRKHDREVLSPGSAV